jgi:rod shape-determining protein MreD
MLDLIWQRIEIHARTALPFATGLLCTLLGVVAWPLPYFGAVAPPLALMAVYYWAVHRPDLFSPGMVFMIGLLNDVVHGLPLGMSALLFVAMHQVILHQRRFFAGHSFFMLWSGFAITAFLVMVVEWFLLGLIGWHVLPVMPILMQLMLAIVLFPIPCWLLICLQRAALSQF